MDGATAVDNILEHFGVKGMKWGVRQRRSRGDTRSKAERKADREDEKFEKLVTSRFRGAQLKNELHNTVGPIVQSKVNQLNLKPEYSKAIQQGTFKNPNHPTSKKYIKEVNDIYLKEMNTYLQGFTSRTGRKKIVAELSQEDYLGFKLTVVDRTKARHADDSSIRIEYIRDENGAIVGFKVVDDELTQGELVVGGILEHFGVKGMKWGVRRNRPSGVTISDKGKKLKTRGGYGRPASSDAVRARTLGQISRKSGVKALSDQELQAYSRRLNLEQQVKRLEYNEKNAAKRFVLSVLGQSGRTNAQNAANEGFTRVGRKALKLAATAA